MKHLIALIVLIFFSNISFSQRDSIAEYSKKINLLFFSTKPDTSLIIKKIIICENFKNPLKQRTVDTKNKAIYYLLTNEKNIDTLNQILLVINEKIAYIENSLDIDQREKLDNIYGVNINILESIKLLIQDNLINIYKKKQKKARTLNNFLYNENFFVSQYPNKELVRGDTGMYFIVNLKNETNACIEFDIGKYDTVMGNYQNSLHAFTNCLINLSDFYSYKIYTIGSATQERNNPIISNLNDTIKINILQFKDNQYDCNSTQIKIKDVKNSDLAMLRAQSLAFYIQHNSNLSGIKILEYSSKIICNARKAMIIVYLKEK